MMLSDTFRRAVNSVPLFPNMTFRRLSTAFRVWYRLSDEPNSRFMFILQNGTMQFLQTLLINLQRTRPSPANANIMPKPPAISSIMNVCWPTRGPSFFAVKKSSTNNLSQPSFYQQFLFTSHYTTLTQ